MTPMDLFLFLTLPLLVAFAALIFTRVYSTSRLPSMDEKLGRLPSMDEKLGRLETHTSRLPAMEQKLDELRVAVEGGRSQSVVVKLEKTGLDAKVSVRDRIGDTTEVTISFKTPIIPQVAANIIGRWSQIGKGGQIVGGGATPYDISLKVREVDPEASASVLKEFLALFDQELSREKEWEARLEKSLRPQP